MLKSGVVVSTADRDVQMWKERVRGTVRAALVDRHGYNFMGYSGPLRVDMVFILPIKDMKRHGEWCTAKPDKDNLEKLVLDAMDGASMFLVGDQQVAAGMVSKFYGSEEAAGVNITISPLREWRTSGAETGVENAERQVVDKPDWLG
jgi:Holliday junction resolvase RusA-like endonuclease